MKNNYSIRHLQAQIQQMELEVEQENKLVRELFVDLTEHLKPINFIKRALNISATKEKVEIQSLEEQIIANTKNSETSSVMMNAGALVHTLSNNLINKKSVGLKMISQLFLGKMINKKSKNKERE